MKMKLSHEVNGRVFTRTTRANYTHVVVIYTGGVSRLGDEASDHVRSWHGSEAAAEKTARSVMASFARHSCSAKAVVEVVNGWRP